MIEDNRKVMKSSAVFLLCAAGIRAAIQLQVKPITCRWYNKKDYAAENHDVKKLVVLATVQVYPEAEGGNSGPKQNCGAAIPGTQTHYCCQVDKDPHDHCVISSLDEGKTFPPISGMADPNDPSDSICLITF